MRPDLFQSLGRQHRPRPVQYSILETIEETVVQRLKEKLKSATSFPELSRTDELALFCEIRQRHEKSNPEIANLALKSARIAIGEIEGLTK
jgi:hypothetical protein